MDLGESADENSKATWGCEALNILYVDDQGCFSSFFGQYNTSMNTVNRSFKRFLQWYNGAENVLP